MTWEPVVPNDMPHGSGSCRACLCNSERSTEDWRDAAAPVPGTFTPGRNDVDEIGEAMGVAYADGEELKVGEKEEGRDKHRWELDPASSEDYVDRTSDPE